MRAMIDENRRLVARTLSRAGVPACDLDDEIQRTFMTAASRIADVRPGAERSFLFHVAVNTALHARRALSRRRDLPTERVPERIEEFATPENLADRRQLRRLFDELLASMPEPLRTVFVLYELEEMDTLEIAAHLGIPRGTVSSRLRRARAELRQRAEAIEVALDRDVPAPQRIGGPAPLRRERTSSLEGALLAAGVFKPTLPSMHARTLATLALR